MEGRAHTLRESRRRMSSVTRSDRSGRSCFSASWYPSRSSTMRCAPSRSRRSPAPLASQLVEQGTVQELDVLRALSEQHGVPGIDLTQIAILLEHLDLVPREVAETNRILPVLVRGDRIFLAMARPAREARGRRARVRHRQEGLPVHRGALDAHQGDRRGVRREGAGRAPLPRAPRASRDAPPARTAGAGRGPSPARSADA